MEIKTIIETFQKKKKLKGRDKQEQEVSQEYLFFLLLEGKWGF